MTTGKIYTHGNASYLLGTERIGDGAPAFIPDRTSNKVIRKVSFPRGQIKYQVTNRNDYLDQRNGMNKEN